MNNRLILILTGTLLLGTATAAPAADGEGSLAGLQIGMTEAQVGSLHPGGQLTLGGIDLAFEGRFGDFSRGGRDYQGGLTMYKLRPQQVADQAQCEQFGNSLMSVVEEAFGETQGEITPGEPTWQVDGLWISLSANWFAEADQCSAEVFVRATDLTPK